MNRAHIRDYFERIATVWDFWRQRNRFYHSHMTNLIRGMVSPGSRVLELGSGTGDLLAALEPADGIGLNVAEGLTVLARQKYPHLQFETVEVDHVKIVEGFAPNYIVLNNLLDYVYDVWDLLERLRPAVTHRTLLVITSNNPLWGPLLRLASRFGLRAPDSPRNFITNRDIRGVLELQGFDVAEEGLLLPVPLRVPILGSFLNAVLPELPVLRYTSSIQYVAARLRIPRRAMSCSVVIPCHNEEGNIAECVRRATTHGDKVEVIIVDDGSTDATRRIAEELIHSDPRVRLIVYDTNHGKANAVRAGFDAATGDVVMILDCDMAVAPEELPKFLQALQNGTADFVNGTRLVYPMQGQAMRFANFLGNKAFCLLVSWIVRQRVSDTLCGTKALLRSDYIKMPRLGKERWGDFDLLFGAARLKLRILEIPVHYRERRSGKSKMRALREVGLFLRACWYGWWMLRFPDSVPWSSKPPVAPGWREIHPSGSVVEENQ